MLFFSVAVVAMYEALCVVEREEERGRESLLLCEGEFSAKTQ